MTTPIVPASQFPVKPKALRGKTLEECTRPDGTVEIPLTRGKVALIDGADFHLVASRKWYALNNKVGLWYALTKHKVAAGRTVLGIHQVILGQKQIDHFNHDGLDNRRKNLRPATHSQNSANRGRPQNNRSGFKGVSWDKRGRRWAAYITVNYKHLSLGRFSNAKEAALAYDIASRQHFGEFSRTNYPAKTAPEAIPC
jgi:hypothetical protein